MPLIMNGTTVDNVVYNGVTLDRIIYNGVTVFERGNVVTYIFNGGTYQEYVPKGQSCLSPKSFSTKLVDGSVIGWSTSTRVEDMVSEMIMENSPITLYSVIKYTDITIPINWTYKTDKSIWGGPGYDPMHLNQNPKVLYSFDNTKYYTSQFTITGYYRFGEEREEKYWTHWVDMRCGYHSSDYVEEDGDVFKVGNGSPDWTGPATFTRDATGTTGTTTITAYARGGNTKWFDANMSIENATLYGRTVVK